MQINILQWKGRDLNKFSVQYQYKCKYTIECDEYTKYACSLQINSILYLCSIIANLYGIETIKLVCFKRNSDNKQELNYKIVSLPDLKLVSQLIVEKLITNPNKTQEIINFLCDFILLLYQFYSKGQFQYTYDQNVQIIKKTCDTVKNKVDLAYQYYENCFKMLLSTNQDDIMFLQKANIMSINNCCCVKCVVSQVMKLLQSEAKKQISKEQLKFITDLYFQIVV